MSFVEDGRMRPADRDAALARALDQHFVTVGIETTGYALWLRRELQEAWAKIPQGMATSLG